MGLVFHYKSTSPWARPLSRRQPANVSARAQKSKRKKQLSEKSKTILKALGLSLKKKKK